MRLLKKVLEALRHHQVFHEECDLPVMGPTKLWVWSCWMEEIREPAEEKSQKSQKVDRISAGIT